MSKTIQELAEMPEEKLLSHLIEECSEIIKAVAKWQIYGPFPTQNGIQYDNMKDMFSELNQVYDIHRVLNARFRT